MPDHKEKGYLLETGVSAEVIYVIAAIAQASALSANFA